jgi:ribonuclease-3
VLGEGVAEEKKCSRFILRFSKQRNIMDCVPPIDLQECQKRLGYRFANELLLQEALTHSSSADNRLSSNERLEFLGDAVLGYIICDILFHRYTESLEGDLTKFKSALVSRSTCKKISEKLGMEEFLILGKGIQRNQFLPSSLLSNVVESLIAAIYLDGGMEAARDFIETHFRQEIESRENGGSGDNFKSELQQLAQRDFAMTPYYHLLDEKGPDHSKCFKICAQLGERRFEAAWGNSKKEAEQRAAENAVAQLHERRPPWFGG